MISYERDPQQTIPESSVKIVGLGGAGANMLDRAALDGLSGAEMLCINTDMRTLNSSVANEKIQIGRNLTKGLGAGGDPDVGLKAAHESETEIRDSFRDRKMVFLCVGLGGGTGSGAAPLICRLAREQGAFVVVFATMPFSFEGERRRNQAETALNELAVLANALVTFDNNRMGELVVAKQGIHEAFAAADQMVSESIQAVTRLVVRPGLINVGLDDLMAALRTTRSRCLFGSGIAEGENRTQLALENTLSSPLLDKGSLLADATTVLVHICGGESLTLYEVELLMQGLAKHVPASAHILLGAAVDAEMGDQLSLTLVSALPENKLINREESSPAVPALDLAAAEIESTVENTLPELEDEIESAEDGVELDTAELLVDSVSDEPQEAELEQSDEELELPAEDQQSELTETSADDPEETFSDPVENRSFADVEDAGEEVEVELEIEEEALFADQDSESSDEGSLDEGSDEVSPFAPRSKAAQAELELDGGPKGKFEGESPNVMDGEDLDIPPFLRKKRR